MESIKNLTSNDIPVVLEPTLKAFGPLLEKNRAAILSVPSKTLQYGPTARHQLDIYYPSASTDAHAILVYIYGGGFVSGARRFPPPQDLVYTNVASFFAARGFTVVIPDYRLAPEFKYPAPVEDVQRALHFIHTAPEADTGIPEATRKSIFVLGHSAGAIHTASLALAEPAMITGPLAASVKGLVLSGGTFTFSPAAAPFSQPYYGDAVGSQEPLALLRGASNATIKALPPILLGKSENEPAFIPVAIDAFIEELTNRGRDVELIEYKGHNHISVNLALSTGEGEDWAETVTEWCKEKI